MYVKELRVLEIVKCKKNINTAFCYLPIKHLQNIVQIKIHINILWSLCHTEFKNKYRSKDGRDKWN